MIGPRFNRTTNTFSREVIMIESPEETALLRRRSMALRWEPARWTVGVAWHKNLAQLSIYPMPCVAVDVHLPGRRTRTGVVRWFRARAVVIMIVSAILIATAFGFLAGRLFPVSAIPSTEHMPTSTAPAVVPAASTMVPAPATRLEEAAVGVPTAVSAAHSLEVAPVHVVPPVTPSAVSSVRRGAPLTLPANPYESRF